MIDDPAERELAGTIVREADPARQALYTRLRQAVASTYVRDYALERMIDEWAAQEERELHAHLATRHTAPTSVDGEPAQAPRRKRWRR